MRDHLGEALSAFLDGELAPAARREVESHLFDCPECRLELEDVAFARQAIRDLPVRPVPTRWQGTPAAGDEPARDLGPGPSLVPTPLRRRSARQAIWAAVAAAAAVVAFLLPNEHQVNPGLPQLVDAHATRASVDGEPITTLAPIAVPVRYDP